MHSVQRQIIEIATGSQAQAHEIANRLSQAWDAGVPVVERAFDRQAGAGITRIDRLELDLGVLQGGDWLNLFFDRLADAFERSLADEPDSVARATDATGGVLAANGVVLSDRAGSDFAAVIHFLRCGHLPWWSGLATGPGWLAVQVAALTPAAQAQVARLAADDPVVLRRLVIHLAPKELETALAALIPEPLRGRLAASAQIFARTASSRDARCTLLCAYWRATLFPADLEPSPAGAAWRIGEAWAAALAKAGAVAIQTLLSRPAWHYGLPPNWADPIAQALIAADHPSQTKRKPATAAPQRAAKPAVPQDAQAAPGRQAAAHTAHPSPSPVPGSARSTPPWTAGGKDHLPDLGEAIPVTGAGVVLLHPFLPELFRSTGLWADCAFTTPEASHTAVRLIGYLAFGDCDTDEADLILAKSLCGMDWEEPLLPDPPEADMLTAADALLSAVLRHWSALRSSWVDWLRLQFLRRDGLIRCHDETWTLTVAPRAQDVLLGKLPWGVGVVFLPWMPNPITVKWRD
jgi:Contractile injection system tape measure protein